MNYNFYVYIERARDTVAEWLRRWTANPMCSARVGSNPIGVVLLLAKKITLQIRPFQVIMLLPIDITLTFL